jgi:adenine-specific DNA-methyltransferase
MTAPLALHWASLFGLADVPLFEAGEIKSPKQHTLLLDGGSGSFILSESREVLRKRDAASWAWSSALPNHVHASGDNIIVTRWDVPDFSETFTLRSVNDKLEAFYAYLSNRRNTARPDVVAALLDLFRAVRGEVEAAGAGDDRSVAEFLSVLSDLVASEKAVEARARLQEIWTNAGVRSIEPVLDSNRRGRLEAGFKDQISAAFRLEFSAALAVRHAASAIFQEAHFAFQRAAQADLFGYQPTTTASVVGRGSHHFTPPALARSIVEQALDSIPDLANRERLVVCDPACGSGAFLTETARTLRSGFLGSPHPGRKRCFHLCNRYGEICAHGIQIRLGSSWRPRDRRRRG